MLESKGGGESDRLNGDVSWDDSGRIVILPSTFKNNADVVGGLHVQNGTQAATIKAGAEPAAVVTPPDGGCRAWLVCLASFWTNGAIFGVVNSFGVLYGTIQTEYGGGSGSSSVTTSLVGSLCMGMTFLLSPVAAILTDKFGISRTAFLGSLLAFLGMLLSSFASDLSVLFVTYGIVLGTGASLAYTPSLVVLGHYFKRRLGFVNGLVTAGSSLFTVVLPLALEASLRWVGLSGTLQALAAMMSLLLVCALLFRPPLKAPPSGDRAPKRLLNESRCRHFCNTLVKLVNTKIWRNRKYMAWALAFPVSLVGYAIPYIHLVKYVKKFFPGNNGPLLITCIGAASGVGRLLCGKLADADGVNPILMQQLAFFVMGVLTVLLAAASSYWQLIVLCLGLGLCDGCFISLIGPIAFEIVGSKGASQAIGFLLGICSLPVTLGPPIAGWLYDTSGESYTLAFIVAGVPPLFGSLLMCVVHLVGQPPKQQQQQDDKCGGGGGVQAAEETNRLMTHSATKETYINEECETGGDANAIWKLQHDLKKDGVPHDDNNTWDANDNQQTYDVKIVCPTSPQCAQTNNYCSAANNDGRGTVVDRESVL